MRSKYTTGLLLGLLLGSSSAHGEANNMGSFIADPKNGCKLWNPHPLPGETVSWSGDCIQGLAQGAGTVLWSRNGEPFEKDEGIWDQGRQSGRGTQDWRIGRYEGELTGGEPSGHGIMMLQTSRYEGAFRNGKPNGQGTVTNLEGVFKGTWKDGCLADGKRKITFAVSSATCR
jgi:MORN repeat